MRTFYQHKESCPSLIKTSASYYPSRQHDISIQQKTYLSSMNYHLLNEITDSQTQKNYYRNRLTQQYHTHHDELQNTYATISQKNQFILQLQEQLDRMNKDYRVLSDQYIGLKNQSDSQKQLHQTQINVLKRNYQQKIQKIQNQSLIRLQVQINKRVHQIQSQCQKRIDMFKSQLQQARSNSKQVTHQLKLLQQDYHQVMIKNDTMIQQSINRQLRKRDFQAQNNFLSDQAHNQHMKKTNHQLKSNIAEYIKQIQSMNKQLTRLKAQNIKYQTKLKDIQQAFQHQKNNNRVTLQTKYKTTEQMQTNTQQQFIPVIMPVQINLVGEIMALKQFLTQKMIVKYQQFFTKASLKQKKKSASLITFKNFLNQQLKNAAQNSLLMHTHTGLQRIVKLYCPAMSYSRQFLTVKDEFIRKTLMECQGLNNKQQRLFRLLELIHRLHHPITHVKSQISTGEVKMVQIKIMATLKKIFSSL